jgi:hypothetical protein
MKIKDLYKKIRDGKIISDISLQREIVYDIEKQVLVIDSIVKDIPLPAFYLWKNKKGILEVLDGKQRIEAIKKFIENLIEYEKKIWKLTDTKTQEKINETELSLIICNGEEKLKREIFRRINTLGVALSPYEVLNGLFHGEYLRGLSEYSKKDVNITKILRTNNRGNNQYKVLQLLMLLKKRPKNSSSINEYVDENKNESFEKDQTNINKYIKFIRQVFDKYKELDIYFYLSIKYLKDLSIWKSKKDIINEKIQLYLKSDVSKLTNKTQEIEDIIQAIVKGISVDNKRLFTLEDKEKLLNGLKKIDKKYSCSSCEQHFLKEELQVDHQNPWSLGGRTVISNATILCKSCNIKKSNRI